MYFYTLAKEKLEQNAQNIISNMIKKVTTANKSNDV